MTIDIETLRECIAVVAQIRERQDTYKYRAHQFRMNAQCGWEDACHEIDTRLRQLAREIPE